MFSPSISITFYGMQYRRNISEFFFFKFLTNFIIKCRKQQKGTHKQYFFGVSCIITLTCWGWMLSTPKLTFWASPSLHLSFWVAHLQQANHSELLIILLPSYFIYLCTNMSTCTALPLHLFTSIKFKWIATIT